MKFPQLPLHAWFSWEGDQWQKSAPLLARSLSSGQQRMIPRSAEIEPIAAPVPGGAATTTREAGTTRAAALDEAEKSILLAIDQQFEILTPGHHARLRHEVSEALSRLRQRLLAESP
jgi:hypothetical protein